MNSCRDCRQLTGGHCWRHPINFIVNRNINIDIPSWGHAVCPKHKTEFTCPECTDDMASEMGKILYKNLR